MVYVSAQARAETDQKAAAELLPSKSYAKANNSWLAGQQKLPTAALNV